ncbi:hypothetical protein HG536_0A07350 [Torulaspora globosa]|uniref:Uncharacterized protein n=1 Tax=Torulaspora globosa TaxID=48254 RepID=A0A7G3ZBN4_9SACH|nr:uncharacterized protein HG536_0A07350 [Torulaspora globosa]QLL30920.1 hypothetical protein HG536_0A07350 [Torulaspora globosa]
MLNRLSINLVLALVVAHEASASRKQLTLTTEELGGDSTEISANKPLIVHLDKNSMSPEMVETLARASNIDLADLPDYPEFVTSGEFESMKYSADDILEYLVRDHSLDLDKIKQDERYNQIEEILKEIADEYTENDERKRCSKNRGSWGHYPCGKPRERCCDEDEDYDDGFWNIDDKESKYEDADEGKTKWSDDDDDDDKDEADTRNRKNDERDDKLGRKQDEKSEEKLDDKLDKKLDDKLDEKSEEKLDDNSDKKLGDKLDEKSDEKLDDNSDKKLGDKLDEKSEKKLDDKSDKKLGDKLDEKSEEKLDDKLEDKFDEKLDEKLDDRLDEKVDDKKDGRFDEKLDDTKDDDNASKDSSDEKEDEKKFFWQDGGNENPDDYEKEESIPTIQEPTYEETFLGADASVSKTQEILAPTESITYNSSNFSTYLTTSSRVYDITMIYTAEFSSTFSSQIGATTSTGSYYTTSLYSSSSMGSETEHKINKSSTTSAYSSSKSSSKSAYGYQKTTTTTSSTHEQNTSGVEANFNWKALSNVSNVTMQRGLDNSSNYLMPTTFLFASLLAILAVMQA